MQITKLSLRNFKCFEKVDVSLSKITLLTGPNSSGKSSLIYGLLGPLQSTRFPFYFSPNGKFVNMGDYKEIVFKNIKKRRVGIDVVITRGSKNDEYSLKTDWVADRRTMMPKLYHLSYSTPFVEMRISEDNIAGKYILKLKYDPKKYAKGERAEFFKAMKPLYKWLTKLDAETHPKRKKKTKPFEPDIFKPYNIRRRSFSSLEKLTDELRIIEMLIRFPSGMESDINFISSFRREPERTYYEKSPSVEKVDKYGDNYINHILEWERQKRTEFHELKSILRDLKIAFSLKSKKLPGGRFEFRVKVKSGGIWALISDVGFGISQLLPILVADLQLKSPSTLFVAQPEIHLHPSVQASLADYFVKQSQKKRKRYILETHSEYLLNRIRLAIVQGQMQPSDVSVYYCDNTPAGTKTYEIQFTKGGQIQNAPKSFFDTYMMDVMDIALNAK